MVGLRALFASEPIAACFDDVALVDGMLAFERALARAEATSGVIPTSAADRIEATCATARFDVPALVADARRAGTLAIPLVKALTAQVAEVDAEAARYVHWGATSQDVLDTALVLAARAASKLLLERLNRLGDAIARQVEAHRATPMLARTLLQPATPVPFGWKAAGWLDAMTRSRDGLARGAREFSLLQFGGASGVLAPLGAQGDAVAQALGAALGLTLSPAPWHGTRDSVARLGAEVGIACEAAAKVALDVALMMQPEIGEAFEPQGAARGGSSALPQKRNPVGCMFAREAGLRAPGLVATLIAAVPGEHERGLGHWQSQWWTLGDLFAAAGSGVEAMIEVIEGLVVDAEAMRRNLDRTHGFVYAEALAMALAPKLGKSDAHARIEALCRSAEAAGQSLQEALAADAALAAAVPEPARRRIFEPSAQFGSANTMIDRALDAWRTGSV